MVLPEHQLKASALQRRLGEILIEEHQITAEQLDEASEYQSIYGGRLGTSLIELGLVDEEQLAHILSQQLKQHYIKPELLMNVPQVILNLVPRQLALKYHIVPYHKEQGKLYLAMSDTANLCVIDELSFQLGHILVPLAIPEVRLMVALKKHYGMVLSHRFEQLETQLKYRTKAAPKLTPETQTTFRAATEEPAWPLLGEDETSEDTYFNFAPADTEISVTVLCQRLIAATDRNDIANALIDYLGSRFKGCALLMVRATTATGWLCSHDHREQTDFNQLTIPLQEPSVLNLVAENRTFFLGSIADTPQNNKLLSAFTCKPPQTALVIPIQVKERLVGIVYIQDRLDQLEMHFVELQKLVHKTEMAFATLILKNKILAT